MEHIYLYLKFNNLYGVINNYHSFFFNVFIPIILKYEEIENTKKYKNITFVIGDDVDNNLRFLLELPMDIKLKFNVIDYDKLDINVVFLIPMDVVEISSVIDFKYFNKGWELKAFFKEIKKFSLNNIISIDETSVSTSLGFNYCRNELGQRCIIKTTDNVVFTKYSLVVAITNKKCSGYSLYQKGAVNSDRFNEFIKAICKNVKNKLIILDNGQIHKKESTKKIIKDSGNFLLYTCPYHPRLNAIEQFFNQIKHYLKLYKSKNYEELKLNLSKSIKNIKKEHYKNYFIYTYNKDFYKNL